MIFVCDFFMISREVYEKKSVICPSKCTTNVKTKITQRLTHMLKYRLVRILVRILYGNENPTFNPFSSMIDLSSTVSEIQK